MRFFRSVTIALMFCSNIYPQFAQADTVEICLSLAGSTYDEGLPEGVVGVPFSEIDATNAIEACTEAIEILSEDSLQTARIQYTLGRAYDSAGLDEQARYWYEQTGDSFPLALNNLGAKLIDENGAEAVRYFLRAADGGLGLAAKNAADVYAQGIGGVVPDRSRARELYMRAADMGEIAALRDLALLLQSEPDPDLGGAAEAWRKLAATGDATAAFSLAELISNDKVDSASGETALDLYRWAADGGHSVATLRLAKHLAEAARNSAEALEALTVAYRALDLLQAEPEGTEGAWPVHEYGAASLVVRLIKTHGIMPRSDSEFALLTVDYSSELLKRFTVPAHCGETEISFQVYIWDWSRDIPSSQGQFEWLTKRGCEVSDEVSESFAKLYNIARENGVSFAELTAYALSASEASSTQSVSSDLLVANRHHTEVSDIEAMVELDKEVDTLGDDDYQDYTEVIFWYSRVAEAYYHARAINNLGRIRITPKPLRGIAAPLDRIILGQ